MIKTAFKKMRLILGDQLNASHSWFTRVDDETLYVMAELFQEANYVIHHKQKIAAFFAAMEQFARALEKAGHTVLHLNLDKTREYNDLPDLIEQLISQFDIQVFEYQLPDEYRLRSQLSVLAQQLNVEITVFETEHFFLSDAELSDHFSKGKRHRMEAFYRKMRKQFDLLMTQGEPVGGKWNFDADNRNKIKPADYQDIPEPLTFGNDVSDILQRIERHQIVTLGESDDKLLWPVTRRQAVELLTYFCRYCLPAFGRFQDAMVTDDDLAIQGKSWSLCHARLSFALNSKMLSPHQVIEQAIQSYKCNPQSIDIAQIEGFVRQILGWREFVRGIYWSNMPDYARANALSAKRQLPAYFWHGKTGMNCLSHAIGQSLQYAYAHHIQRLMVTGNFCLLAGINPVEVDQWYLGIYIDAIEWVELPNTRGMSQFADDGIVASKAYAASGNYINKMSNYCSGCDYDVKQTVGEKACPLNALYWHFMLQHQDRFSANPRNKMIYANWNKKSSSDQLAIIEQAKRHLIRIEQL